MAGPLAQFKIHVIGGTAEASLADVPFYAFTNAALWMTISAVAVMAFVLGGARQGRLVPGPWQSTVEASYEFIGSMIRQNVGEEGRRFFPVIFALFMFILFGNLLGLLPYSFTFTSQMIVTAALALLVFVGVTVVGIVKHGLGFFGFFAPSGVPALMIPIMVPIEVISYLSRPVSLSIRLFANMMAGHTMMKVFAGLVFSLGLFGGAPLAMTVVLTGFEVLVSFLQAYVFAVLACLYLNDALHLH